MERDIFICKQFYFLEHNALVHAVFLLGLFLNPEDEGDMLLRNVG
jgi:hypothetical protein